MDLMFTRLPAELGDLIEVHRPVRPLLAWAFLVVLSTPFAVMAAVMPPGPLIGLCIFIGFLVPFTYMFAEWILLQQRIYRHGIVFRSVLGAPKFVIPFYTVQPDRIEIKERHQVPKGEFGLAERHHRESPFVQSSVHLTGLHPKYARKLAKGKVAWDDAGSKVQTVGDDRARAPQDVVRWRASFRDPEHYRELLSDAVLASQRTVPYNRA